MIERQLSAKIRFQLRGIDLEDNTIKLTYYDPSDVNRAHHIPGIHHKVLRFGSRSKALDVFTNLLISFESIIAEAESDIEAIIKKNDPHEPNDQPNFQGTEQS